MNASHTVTDSLARRGKNKAEKVTVRIKAEDKETIKEGAEIAGQSLTDFVVSRSIEAARRIITESRMVYVSQEYYDRFCAAIESEPEPPTSEALEAVAKYRASTNEAGSFDW